LRQSRPSSLSFLSADAAITPTTGAASAKQRQPPPPPSPSQSDWLELDMTDNDSGDVAYVWVIAHCGASVGTAPHGEPQQPQQASPGGGRARTPLQRATAGAASPNNKGVGSNSVHTPSAVDAEEMITGGCALSPTLQRSIPHPPHTFRIENTCGACRTPYALDLSAYRCLRPAASKGTTGELITMLSGTFAPCASRLQVDFRGVRSIAAMQRDWELITGVGPADTTVTVYMLVMKACLGVPALIVDGGTVPNGLEGYSALLAEEGRRRCYLGERMAAWCAQYVQHIDVCQAIELVDIRWGALCASRTVPVDPLLMGPTVRSSVHVSRRGGAMLRLIFPGGTAWDAGKEANVLRECNYLLDVLRRALLGQAW
jgi:hypothetical protein